MPVDYEKLADDWVRIMSRSVRIETITAPQRDNMIYEYCRSYNLEHEDGEREFRKVFDYILESGYLIVPED